MSPEKIIVAAMRGEREEYWRDPCERRNAISDEDYARAIVAYFRSAGYVLVERELVEEAADAADTAAALGHPLLKGVDAALAARLRRAAAAGNGDDRAIAGDTP